ncbi:MAG: hypothetical protein ABS24_05100 [SAR92 bacterium BACL26 MAG-121220-bin70]|uniref:Uncharacterized protein n=1 Tax=SAR92 bacterium BACL26 MAG-121220-bin70 TaxID=1655626 RepID=A0A0R2U206_9GAMM|nr:MAG: hypothetical protein ABS24_05100 [SAR92 bacterium BACL26 MAG-121220-bin70]
MPPISFAQVGSNRPSLTSFSIDTVSLDLSKINQIVTLIVDVDGNNKDNATLASIDEIGRITGERQGSKTDFDLSG